MQLTPLACRLLPLPTPVSGEAGSAAGENCLLCLCAKQVCALHSRPNTSQSDVIRGEAAYVVFSISHDMLARQGTCSRDLENDEALMPIFTLHI